MTYAKLIGLDAVKAAVLAGKRVYWGEGPGYEVKRDSAGQWIIVCAWNQHVVGLYWGDGVTSDYSSEPFVCEVAS